jgi:hypothetical protein
MCDECGENPGRGAWIALGDENKAFCLSCAELDRLVFLPTGDDDATRRAKKGSTLWAVVLKWSRARKPYERQGVFSSKRRRWPTRPSDRSSQPMFATPKRAITHC